jgi:hypothetical protein
MIRYFLFALLCAVLGPGMAVGQETTDPSDPDELRALIERLESQLSAIQQDRNRRNRVTDLGLGSPQVFSDEPRRILRIYDLSDLFSFAPPYPATQGNALGSSDPLFPLPHGAAGAGPGGMGGGGGFFRVGDDPPTTSPPTITLPRPFAAQVGVSGGVVTTTRTSMEQLIDAITSTIEPTQWEDAGGPCSIGPLGTSLLISANLQMHRQIEGLFGAFRERWGTLRTVTVQADWIWLSTAELAEAVQSHPSSAQPGEVPSFGLLDDDAWKALAAKKDRRAGYAATITCTNGQTVHNVAGRQSLVVTDVTPVVGGGENGLGYRPTATPLQEGAAIQMTPVVSASGKFVILDVRTRVLERQDDPDDGPSVEQAKAASKSEAVAAAKAIDRPILACYRFATTLRLPIDRRVLVGGMTYHSAPGTEDDRLYLVVKTSIQELRDDVENNNVLETETTEAADTDS